MRKDELIHAILACSKSSQHSQVIANHLAQALPNRVPGPKAIQLETILPEKTRKTVKKSKVVEEKSLTKKSENVKSASKNSPQADDTPLQKIESESQIVLTPKISSPKIKQRQRMERDISTFDAADRADQLVLLVRDAYWLQATWELGAKTLERVKVALGHAWYTAVPILRLVQLNDDGSSQPKRTLLREITIHGGVNHWYLDVQNPPASFFVELGYLCQNKRYYPVATSNTVTTPHEQIRNELDRVDGNWRGVSDDLGRVFKLSVGDGSGQELRRVFEEQLHRSVSNPLLSTSQGGMALNQIPRNFALTVDVDVLIYGRTEPGVRVSVRNETIKVEDNGEFSVRFSLPDRRHIFPLEAVGADGVEKHRTVLTLERYTRVLETVFQDPGEED